MSDYILGTRERLFKNMFSMQKKLNDITNGKGWEKRNTCLKTGKPIYWSIEAALELAEAIESLDHKHWKHGTNDMDNYKIELIDAWHFMMSGMLAKEVDVDTLFNNVKIDIFNEPEIAPIHWLIDDTGNLLVRVNYINLNTSSMSVVTRILFKLSRWSGMLFEEFYLLYLGKNFLNEFRQMNGYAEGTYQKTWNGVEDNHYLTSWVNNGALNYNSSELSDIEILKSLFMEHMTTIYNTVKDN